MNISLKLEDPCKCYGENTNQLGTNTCEFCGKTELSLKFPAKVTDLYRVLHGELKERANTVYWAWCKEFRAFYEGSIVGKQFLDRYQFGRSTPIGQEGSRILNELYHEYEYLVDRNPDVTLGDEEIILTYERYVRYSETEIYRKVFPIEYCDLPEKELKDKFLLEQNRILEQLHKEAKEASLAYQQTVEKRATQAEEKDLAEYLRLKKKFESSTER